MVQTRNWYGEASPMTPQDWDKFDDFRRRQSDLNVMAVDAAGASHMYPVLSLAEAFEKFEELRAAGVPQVFIKNGNRTIQRLAARG
ncbi:MAG: hypothetical protein JWP51_1729 [Bradyrhizobium sp.]|jgi:hypothetical protein|nr:hypothetical protein [Bradyrhizobium sp.]